MKSRKQVTQDLEDFQTRLKELEIRYEQYFAGVERREPYLERKDLTRQIRNFNPQQITQTDLKFRYQGLSSRLASYSQYWDRILRLIDEGKYHRHLNKITKDTLPPCEQAQPEPLSEADSLYRELVTARERCGVPGETPSPQQIASFLAAQRAKIREKFGDKPVEFLVDTSIGKPRIKVRLKQ